MPFPKLLIILTLFFSSGAFAQVYSGTVVEAPGDIALPYVNIGISGKATGTISDAGGKFAIHIPDSLRKDSLTFFCSGYLTLTVSITSLFPGTTVRIYPITKELQEYQMVSKGLKSHRYGLSGMPLLHFSDASMSQNDIFEIA
ncbi:MAG: hypothetical protein EOP49_12790 [Sphingobacteriales bacterium]|nr:MAG: hypothetical protein EOP49_12790 [Sphingobacteriales bacterium]